MTIKIDDVTRARFLLAYLQERRERWRRPPEDAPERTMLDNKNSDWGEGYIAARVHACEDLLADIEEIEKWLAWKEAGSPKLVVIVDNTRRERPAAEEGGPKAS